MKQRLQASLHELQTVSSQTSKVLASLSSASGQMSRKNSETLIGTLGGLLGMSGAYAVTVVMSTASLPIVGVLMTATGVLAGILCHRGARRIRLERRIAENRIASEEILDRIKQLPKNAPQDVRDSLWLTYRSLVGDVESQLLVTLNARNNQLPSPRLLPQQPKPIPLLPAPKGHLEIEEVALADRKQTKDADHQ